MGSRAHNAIGADGGIALGLQLRNSRHISTFYSLTRQMARNL